MKAMLFSLSLTFSLVVFCIFTFSGFRFWPAVQRSLITFVATYSSGLILAVVVFVPLISRDKGQTHQKMKDAKTQNENDTPKEVTKT